MINLLKEIEKEKILNLLKDYVKPIGDICNAYW